jgi:hypothetical protein
MILTVESPALVTASRSSALPGSDTGPAELGASWAKTGGNPSEERKFCMLENTEGGAGSTLSKERMILESAIEALRLSEVLLTRVLANSKAALPSRRPATPHTRATPSMVASATAVRAAWTCAHRTVTDASRAPR